MLSNRYSIECIEIFYILFNISLFTVSPTREKHWKQFAQAKYWQAMQHLRGCFTRWDTEQPKNKLNYRSNRPERKYWGKTDGVSLTFFWICCATWRVLGLGEFVLLFYGFTIWIKGGLTNCKMLWLRPKVKCRVQSEDNPPELKVWTWSAREAFTWKVLPELRSKWTHSVPHRLINMNTFSIDCSPVHGRGAVGTERGHRHSNVFLLMRACGAGCVLLWVFQSNIRRW